MPTTKISTGSCFFCFSVIYSKNLNVLPRFVIGSIYGYEAGNLVLHNFAQQVLMLLDAETKFFRLNGVKFAIVMHSATHEEIQKLYEQLKNIVNKQLYLGKNQAKLYFGAAVCPTLIAGQTYSTHFPRLYNILRWLKSPVLYICNKFVKSYKLQARR